MMPSEIRSNHTNISTAKTKESAMFNKNKKQTEILPARRLPKEELGIVGNKNSEVTEGNQEENRQSRSDMQSEGGRI